MTSPLVTEGAIHVVGRVPPLLAVASLPSGLTGALSGVVGLLIGSFLNVVIYRVPRGLSVVEPRSFCPHCDAPLRSLDNVPLLSWMVLRGRCRFCRGPISIRYPLVELATGAAFAVVGLTFGGHWGVPGFCALAATFIALVGIEGDGMALPARVAVVGTAVAVALLVAAGAADRRWSHVIGLALGTAVAGTVAVAIGPERPRRGSGSASRAGVEWGAGAALLPAGAALGWLGPWAGAEGLGTAVVVALVAGRSRGRGSSETDGRPRRRVALALALGVVVATVVARATGAGPGT